MTCAQICAHPITSGLEFCHYSEYVQFCTALTPIYYHRVSMDFMSLQTKSAEFLLNRSVAFYGDKCNRIDVSEDTPQCATEIQNLSV